MARIGAVRETRDARVRARLHGSAINGNCQPVAQSGVPLLDFTPRRALFAYRPVDVFVFEYRLENFDFVSPLVENVARDPK